MDKKKQQDEEKVNKQNVQAVSPEEFEKLQTEFSNLQELTGRLDGQLKRAVADYQNLEKRVAEGRSELSSWASGELIRKILPVLGHLEKVVEMGRPVLSEQSESKEWFRGVELSVGQLKGILKEQGLEEIDIDPGSSSGTGGTRFNPSLHEAVDTREGDDNIILEIAEKGYTLGGKVIKPAKVVVGRKQNDHPEES